MQATYTTRALLTGLIIGLCLSWSGSHQAVHAGELGGNCHGGCASSSCGCGGGHNGEYLADCFNTCNMPPHYRYFPQSHGNYYFRPYHYLTILHQQDAVRRYGGDPRHPYDNSFFEALYEQVESGEEREDVTPPEPLPLTREAQSRAAQVSAEAPPRVHVDSSPRELAIPSNSRSLAESGYSIRFVAD